MMIRMTTQRIKINELTVELRNGTADDVPLLLSFVQQMAEFEKLTVTATESTLRETLFGEDPIGRVLFASVDGREVAYATWFFTFGSMAGKRGLWLDDLFVLPAFRGKGIGTAMLAHLAEIAIQHNCSRFEWTVLDWNEHAIEFYRRLGASILPDWRICRLNEAQLPAMAAKSPPQPK